MPAVWAAAIKRLTLLHPFPHPTPLPPSRYHSSPELYSSIHPIFLASLLTCFLFNAFCLFSLTHLLLLLLFLLSQKQTCCFSLKLSALRITIAAARAALREACPHPAGLVWRLSRSPLLSLLRFICYLFSRSVAAAAPLGFNAYGLTIWAIC